MKELLLNGCACLAYLAVAFLVWWVRDEWREASGAVLLTRRIIMSQRVTFMEPTGLPAVTPRPKPELARRGLSVPLVP